MENIVKDEGVNMSDKGKVFQINAKMDFLTQILGSLGTMSSSIDERAATLLAANALLLTGIIGFGVPAVTSTVLDFWIWVNTILAFTSLISSIVSILFINQIIGPIAIKKKEREKMMDLGFPKSNLLFSLEIAEYAKEEYINKIKALSEEHLIEQLAADIHNLSRILKYRIPKRIMAHRAFVTGVLSFSLLALSHLFF